MPPKYKQSINKSVVLSLNASPDVGSRAMSSNEVSLPAYPISCKDRALVGAHSCTS